jgi:hypothetical protein
VRIITAPAPVFLDGGFTLESGFGPVVDVTLAGDVVRRHAIVREVDDRILSSGNGSLAEK